VSTLDPTGRHLTLEVEHHDHAVVVRAHGELDIASGPRLVGEAAGAAAGGALPVVLDLAGVAFVDSSGLRALIEAERAVRGQGGRLVIARPSPAVARLLDMTGLREAFAEARSTAPGDVRTVAGP
jgi:anti-sigma B factor antagonist